MIYDLSKRTLTLLAERYYKKNKNRTDLENWVLAEKLLEKLEKRYNVKKRKDKKFKKGISKRVKRKRIPGKIATEREKVISELKSQ